MSIKYNESKKKVMNVKKNHKYKNRIKLNGCYLLLFILIPLMSCTTNKEAHNKPYSSSPDELIIWAHSDIQPRKKSERKYYEIAISDITTNFPNTSIALVAGDLIHWSKSEDVFIWYNSMKAKTLIKYWYEIAGNHDQKDYENYKKHIKMPLHYSVRIGNIIILCLSDENKKAETEISDQAFEWWKNMVIDNQDKIIITMSHGFVRKSWLFGAIVPSRNIRDSGRFEEILKKYKVDIWISGHTHLSHSLKGSLRIANKLNNTVFINVSAIRGGRFMDVESFLLFFKQNSDTVIIRSRNHEQNKFQNYYKTNFNLSHKFQWDGSPPVIEEMKYQIIHPVNSP
jgi:predicted phosphodiesterase